jgi:hypothetical protein
LSVEGLGMKPCQLRGLGAISEIRIMEREDPTEARHIGDRRQNVETSEILPAEIVCEA